MGSKQSRHQNQSSHCYHYNDSYSYRAPSLPPASPYSSYSSMHLDFHTKSVLQSRYSRIGDEYHSLEQVTQALAQAGLESSNLIVGIDFTKSNEWTGARCFHKKSLHHLGESMNPYEQAISIIGRTLSSFDEDNLIPCYGFGDATTHDQEVFSFYPDDRPCNGFEDILNRYREIVPQLNLAGPTSFAPIIETAIGITNSSGGQYHVLVIIADGQVTRSINTVRGMLSPQEQNTINAIVEASNYPLSIVLVGVGDGPWDMMHKFDDNIPARAFDNFQFVNFTEIMSKPVPMSVKETQFALHALMEIPSQYKATIDLQLLRCRRAVTKKYSLPPPLPKNSSVIAYQNPRMSSSDSPASGSYYNASPASIRFPNSKKNSNYRSGSNYDAFPATLNGATSREQSSVSSYNSTVASVDSSNSRVYSRNCPVCLWNTKDFVFGCGHQTCFDCGRDLMLCPICRAQVITRIRLYE